MQLTPLRSRPPGAKTSGMVALVGRLKARGVPIDGIGTQTQIQLGLAGTIAANLQTLANTGWTSRLLNLILLVAPVARMRRNSRRTTRRWQGCVWRWRGVWGLRRGG
jgi:endo-1,4-beta-xylanase